MHLTILTPNKKIFEGSVSTCKFPGDLGKFQVLKGHAPIISMLKSGYIFYKVDSTVFNFKITSGVVEVLNNEITVLVSEE